MKRALIFEGRVTDVKTSDYPVHSDFVWVDCPDNVKIDFLYDGTTFTDPTIPTAEQIAEENAIETTKRSGNQKLLDLGLTQEEATLLTGYKPSE